MRLAILLVLLTACEAKIGEVQPLVVGTGADIHCEGIQEGFECRVVQVVGTAESEVCFDIAITCGDGGVVKAPRTCAKVKDGGTTKAMIPYSTLQGDQCSGDKTKRVFKILNQTIDGLSAEAVPTRSE